MPKLTLKERLLAVAEGPFLPLQPPHPTDGMIARECLRYIANLPLTGPRLSEFVPVEALPVPFWIIYYLDCPAASGQYGSALMALTVMTPEEREAVQNYDMRWPIGRGAGKSMTFSRELVASAIERNSTNAEVR